MQPRPPELGGQAEVQEHDATLPGHEHVGGLDVAVELARRVERRDPLGELPQGPPQPTQLERRQAGFPVMPSGGCRTLVRLGDGRRELLGTLRLREVGRE